MCTLNFTMVAGGSLLTTCTSFSARGIAGGMTSIWASKAILLAFTLPSPEQDWNCTTTSVVVLTKTHDWLAVTCVALYLIGGCGASSVPPWPKHELITTEPEIEQLGLQQFLSAAPAAEEAETTSSRGSLSDKAKAAFVQKCNKYYMEFMNKNPTIVFSPGNSGTRRKDFKTFLRKWAGTTFPGRKRGRR